MIATLPGGCIYPTSTCVVDGQRWEIDTNGAAMVCRAVAESNATETPGDHLSIAREPIQLAWPKAAQLTTVPDLEEFLGPAEQEADVPCTECDGTGNVEHKCSCHMCEVNEETCGACDGELRVTEIPKMRPVRILGVAINANLLASGLLLAKASGPCGIARIGPDCIAVGGEGWRVYLIRMNLNAPDMWQAPKFAIKVQS